MEILNEKALLSEGLFSASLQEISYTSVIEQLRKLTKQLKDSISKTTACKSIEIYDDKKIFPNIFTVSAKDFRMTAQQYLSEPFSIFDLERKSGLTENIIVREINDIFNELNYAYKDLNLTLIRQQNDPNSYRFYAYMDFKKCFKNILSYKQPKMEKPARDMVQEFKENKDDVILEIKKHPLGKTLKFDKTYQSEIYKYRADSGSGLCYCLQGQNNGFIEKDFESLTPRLSSWSVTMNLSYFLAEDLLKDTNMTLVRFQNNNGSFSLWLVSNPNIKITY